MTDLPTDQPVILTDVSAYREADPADPFALDDVVVTVAADAVPVASSYGCGDDTCQNCYPVFYRCRHDVEYPRPIINNAAARAEEFAWDECAHHEYLPEPD